MDKLHSTTLHQSLTKEVLYAGAEREIFIFVCFASLMIWFAGKDLLAGILAFSLWTVGITIARILVKKDTCWTKVYLRHIKYQKFYPAGEKIKVPEAEVKIFQVTK
ncbi:MAG: VirB3 family type IV secretion system protein [Candidatus Omnitrophica bacterium]|nr:VirB3 family type IV secretion system protein [Candidatus Omnitrophota bacterium]